MDTKRVIFAVAGSGKTTYIINQLNLEKRALIITYTLSNLYNIRLGVIKKFGFVPSNIKIISYFNFLYSFCYRPLLSLHYKAKGINWKPNPNTFAKNDKRYFDDFNRLYSNRIAKWLEEKSCYEDINLRLSKYFDVLYIDEVQDFAGHDFNLLKNIAPTPISMLFVGDFYQHTFDTSRDANVNSSLHDNYNNYQVQFQKAGFMIDMVTLLKSYRCSPTICKFISEKIGIPIQSHRTDTTEISHIEESTYANTLFQNQAVIKLFYQEGNKYYCYSKNWGDCKGEDKYYDVCVVLNKKTLSNYSADRLIDLPSRTKNKLYVACSRTKNDLFLVSDSFYKLFKQE